MIHTIGAELGINFPVRAGPQPDAYDRAQRAAAAAQSAPGTTSIMHSTRERILHHLKRAPGASVDVLAHALDLAPMTIRQHLSRLAGEGLVEATAERRPTGRPAHVYTLTPASDGRFPKAYDRLAHLLLEEMESAEAGTSDWSTPAGRRRAFQRLAERAAAPHRPELDALPWSQRAERAVGILRDESGFAELSQTGAGLEVREYNCVFQRVAEGHEDVCGFHTAYVSELLGAPVTLDACQCDGANACRFRVEAVPAARA